MASTQPFGNEERLRAEGDVAVRVHQHHCRLDVTGLSIDHFAQLFQDICHRQAPLAIISNCWRLQCLLGALTVLDIGICPYHLRMP